jgi:NADH-quinone oxidoreductase subunit K
MTEYQLGLLQIDAQYGQLSLFLQGNLLLACILFGLGIVGFFLKQNAISMFMCVELMLNAANLVFISFALLHGQLTGAIVVLFTITVAAAEAGVGLAIFISMSRTEAGIDVDQTTILREVDDDPGAESAHEEEGDEQPSAA